MPGSDACMTSSSVSATPANISGLIRPQKTPRNVFSHSTDSGIKLAVACNTKVSTKLEITGAEQGTEIAYDLSSLFLAFPF